MEKINPDLILDINNDISDQLVLDETLEVVRACFQCGTCTGGCPSGRRTAIRTRQIIRKALIGLDEVLTDYERLNPGEVEPFKVQIYARGKVDSYRLLYYAIEH